MKNNIKLLIMLGLSFVWSYLTIHSFGYGHKIIYCFATMLLLYGISLASKTLAKLIIVSLSLVALILYPTVEIFGTPNANMLAAIKYSSWEEGAELWHILISRWLFLGLINLTIGLVVVRYGISQVKSNSTISISSTLIFILVIYYKPVFANTSGSYASEIGYPPVRFVIDAIHGWGKIVDYEYLSGKERDKKTDYSVVKRNSRYNTYILVVGESERRDYMGLYGYPMNNTPFASLSNGIFFDNYTSAGPSTVISLTNSFLLNRSGRLEFNNSIINLAKVSGLQTYWLSNQGRFGIYDGPVAEIGKESDYSYFIKKADSQDGEYYPDEKLLPEIGKALNDKRAKLIIVHIMGSHPDSCARVNWKYHAFHVSKAISCYIQSIQNTDTLLEKISLLAGKSGSSWTMMYFSDHGLAHANDFSALVHSDKNKENYNVPFFVISSDSKEKIRISERRNGLDFLKIFIQWIGVTEKHTTLSCNYFVNDICTNTQQVINGNYELENHSSLADDPAK